ncbi:MAG: ABC transporter permease [Candidatus Cloacimonetes bacterium]|nr:ABC transporter permease [Candidatus Cloacimonadota bacterium]MCF7814887.1 ABC transporter permease [Candidatus Cloacimonadota bacterium]MCF7869210.1 ABC transporter permease [Candidatus Cloacimonadota bacterium]MCF7884641.1 ABC transporter permease [Candidatus Cloacimonadota bacterium]
MLKNYFKVAFRNIARHKGFSFINIIGLAIGMAVCILILLWVRHELSYDRFHVNVDNIFRVVEMQEQSGEPFPVAVTPAALGPAILEDFPEVINFTRFQTYSFGYIPCGEEMLKANITLADHGLFEMFSFSILAGDKQKMFDDLFNMVISEETAYKIFGDENPIGQTIELNENTIFNVTGVFQNIPDNSHLDFDFVVPFEILKEFGGDLEGWGSNSYYTYIQLQENANWQELDKKIDNYLTDHDAGYPVVVNLQPLTEIHLHSHYVADLDGHGDIIYVRIFSIIALFILLIACINFMNLSTARSTKRAREVGLRKIVGSSRNKLIIQFFGESIFLAIIAMIVALVFVELAIPFFNDISGKELSLFNNSGVIWLLLLLTVITGLMSGIYPALLLSSFKPVSVLKSSLIGGQRKGVFRKILVIVQFSLSIILIISTILIHKQINFIFQSDVGFSRDQIVSFSSRGLSSEDLNVFKEEVKNISGINSITATSQYPTDFANSGYGFKWEGLGDEERVLIHNLTVGYDFFESFEMEMVEGRSFSRQFPSDTLAYVINEKAVEVMGFSNPTEQMIEDLYAEISGPIIGVVKNFNYKHIRNKVEPLVIRFDPNLMGVFHAKIQSGNIQEVLDKMETVWQEFVPDNPFEYRFLDDMFERMYNAEKQMGKIFDYFTGFAILISCLGLFGLASFMTEQRFKEIGIRKVLGASISSVMLLLVKEFTKWVLIANIIAWPVAWFVMNKWLQSFAYKTDFGLWIFVVSGLSALIVAVITISFRSFNAAIQNPVKALKYE